MKKNRQIVGREWLKTFPAMCTCVSTNGRTRSEAENLEANVSLRSTIPALQNGDMECGGPKGGKATRHRFKRVRSTQHTRTQVASLHLKAASSRRTPKRHRRKKIQTNICQVFILHSVWGFILRPPKGGTTSLVPPFFSAKTREKTQKKKP